MIYHKKTIKKGNFNEGYSYLTSINTQNNEINEIHNL